jgi:hypothetical protein
MPLSKSQIATLEGFGVTTKNEEAARKELLSRLEAQQLDGFDNDPIQELIEMYAALNETAAATPAKKAKPTKKAAVQEPETTEEELDELAKEVEDAIDDNDEEEEVVTKAPAKKSKPAKAPVKKVVAAVEEEESEEEEEVVVTKAKAKVTAKAAPAKAKKATKVTSAKFDPANAEHKTLMSEVEDMFDETKYELKPISGGLSVRLKETNSTNRSLLTYSMLKVKDGELVGELALNALRLDKGREIALQNINEKYTEDRLKVILHNMPIIPNVTQTELKAIVTKKLLTAMEAPLVKLDGKLNQNRVKMEEAIKSTKKDTPVAAAKPVTKKK